jgi:hypothetical protein
MGVGMPPSRRRDESGVAGPHRTVGLFRMVKPMLDPNDYERMVVTLMSGGSDPVITKKPTGAWTHAVYDAMK